ncbi:MAG: thioredoxin family protein [Candidatus Bathycorpusculaceae bacterium]
MKEVTVEVIGVDPPCKRCQATYKSVEEAASALEVENISVKISKINVQSKDTIAKYGVLVSPALAVNAVVKIIGRAPDKKEVERILRAAIK